MLPLFPIAISAISPVIEVSEQTVWTLIGESVLFAITLTTSKYHREDKTSSCDFTGGQYELL